MPIPRSTSASHVAGALAAVSLHRPYLPRSKSVLGERRVDLHVAHVECEDPFNLSSFFPPHLARAERVNEFPWLQENPELVERQSTRSDHSMPFVESEWLPATPSDTEAPEELAEATIQREDKLGILAFGDLFAVRNDGELYSEDHLLSPYSENGLTDEEGLYSALSALRHARDGAYLPRQHQKQATPLDELFCSHPEGVLEVLTGNGDFLLCGGIRFAMDLFDTRL